MNNKEFKKSYKEKTISQLDIPNQLESIKSQLSFEPEKPRKDFLSVPFLKITSVFFMFLSYGLAFLFFNLSMNQYLTQTAFEDFLYENTDNYIPYPIFEHAIDGDLQMSFYLGLRDDQNVLFYVIEPHQEFLIIVFNFLDQAYINDEGYGEIMLDLTQTGLVNVTVYISDDYVIYESFDYNFDFTSYFNNN